jgi:hypothetical protein
MLRELRPTEREFIRRNSRRKELEDRYGFSLPKPFFTLRSIIEWMLRPRLDLETYQFVIQKGREFFEPLKVPGAAELYSSCTYKQVAAYFLAIHGDPHDPDIRAQTSVTAHSGLHEHTYDGEKFTYEVRQGWLKEAASLALGHADEAEISELAQTAQELIETGQACDDEEVFSQLDDGKHYSLAHHYLVRGVNCATITQAIRKATGRNNFIYCPIGKLGDAPKRDRWDHCPSVCAERGAMAEWYRYVRELMIKRPQWLPVRQKYLYTTAVPCYFCAMGCTQEAQLALVVIGSLKQRPQIPWLNLDDEIALDVLAQGFCEKEAALMLYDREEADRFLRHLELTGR